MQNIIIDNDDFNYILSSYKKKDINEFVVWYESLVPEFHFIKDKKKTFQKNSKNIFSSHGLKSVIIGESISWDRFFFLNHYHFLPSLIQILENKNFDYWSNYLQYIKSLSNLPISHAYEIICYAIENKDFLDNNKQDIIALLEKSISLISLPKNHAYIEKYINIFEYSLANKSFDIEWLLIQLSSFVPHIPKEQIKYHLKNVFSTNNILDLEIDYSKLSLEIIPFLQKQKTHQEIIGTGFHFSINIKLFSISPSYSNVLNEVQISYQLNVLSNFIHTIQQEQKIFWFIDSHFTDNNNFQINAFPKNKEALELIRELIDICLYDNHEEFTLNILLNRLYLETATPISSEHKKQEINKF